MAEVPKTASVPSSRAGTRSGSGFELRLERGAAHVRLAAQPVTEGLTLAILDLAVPDVRFPFDVGLGSGQFRHRLSDLDELVVTAEPALADAALAGAAPAALGLAGLRVAFREGFAEVEGHLAGGARFTLRAGLVSEGERGFRVVFHAPRLYGPAPIPAGTLVHTGRRLLELLGEETLPDDPVWPLLRRVLAPRGWKIPRAAGVRLARAEFAGGLARLAWSRQAVPAAVSTDPELLAAEEGARTFEAAEALLAGGDLDGAREAYLSAPGAATHPFAAERLLGLLAVDERFHDEALDMAASWLARKPGFAPSLSAEAAIRMARGEEGRAARALAALAEASAARGEVFGAVAAAEAAFGLAGAAPADARQAADTALAVKRDHVPALRALRDLAARSGDREALVRASRRLVAYDPDDAQKARAHAQLGELLLGSDPPAARLHLDQALRHAPEDPEALASLARACEAAGEFLRAVRALDRLREVHAARGERDLAAAAAFRAGVLWDEKLDHPENALLRFREACELAPSADTHARAAGAAARAGQWAEAADHHGAVLATFGRGAPAPADLAVRTRVALAEIAERRLTDPVAAAAHLEAAAALAPDRADILRRLAGLDRQLGRTSALADALGRLARLVEDRTERAGVLAEAGEAALSLGLAADARDRFAAALAADERCRPALEGLAHLAGERGDAAAERDALLRLVPFAAPGEESAALQDRLAVACERAGDLGGAHRAVASARAAAPTPARLDAALRLARRGGDAGALAVLLAERAATSAAAGDAAAAAETWLERARLLAASDPGQALAALAEARAAAPGDTSVLRAQAAFGEEHRDPRLALGALRGLLAQAPGDSPVLEVRAGRAAMEAGEPAAARDHAERALARNAPGAGELLADILDRTGDETGRADLLERIGRPLEAARLHERQGDMARARAALERAAQLPETAGEALGRLAELRLLDGDRRGAAAALLTLSARTAGRDGARLALRAFEVGGDPAALDAAAGSDPAFAPARARRAERRAAADPRGALADAEAALGGDLLAAGERPALLALAARAAEAAGEPEAALRHLTAYADANPADDAALTRLAALQRRAGRGVELARTLARRLPLATGTDAVSVRLDLSDLLVTEDLPRAVALAEEALSRDPTSTRALVALAQPPRAGAVPPAEQAARLGRLAARPDIPAADAAAAQAARARILAGLGEHAEALVAARAAAAHGPEDDAALDLRADLARKAGDRAEEARALLDLARRARDRQDPLSAERLAEAGLAARAAGVPGAEEALKEAFAAGVERETARTVLEAVAELSRERGDTLAERDALAALVPHLPTGARPAALLRHSALALGAGDPALARTSAEEARVLAPRDPVAVEAARAAAFAQGDLAAVAERRAELAELEPAAAGAHLLDRAHLLAGLGQAADADAAFLRALAALPPDRKLADQHALHRRGAGLPGAAAPLETYARRAEGPDSARALRAASALALAGEDWETALRCARRAVARTRDDPGFAGPLLARILYLRGSAAEALVLHRRLFEAPPDALSAEDRVTVLGQLAELAADAGERDLAVSALDALLELRPHDLDAALHRLSIDPDRRKAIEGLADAAERIRSVRRRALALQRAGEAALLELDDRVLADRLLRRARAEAEPDPVLAVRIARARASVIRAALGVGSDAFLDALEEAAAAAQAAGDPAGARVLYAETAALLRERGQLADAARLLLQLAALAAADGDFAGSTSLSREAGLALRDAGDLPAAEDVLRGLLAANPADAESLALLRELLASRGAAGASALVRLLAGLAVSAAPGQPRTALLVQLADAQSAAADPAGAEASLRAALTEVPGHPAASDRLLRLLDAQGRIAEQAALLLARAEADPVARQAIRREAAALLARSPDGADRERALSVLEETARTAPGDLTAARDAAQALVAAGQRERALPFLEAITEGDPDDEAAAALLAEAFSDSGRHASRAALFLSRALAAKGEARAARLREAARSLQAAGDPERAAEAQFEAYLAWPADGPAFTAALRAATGDADRLDRVLAARAEAVPGEAAACHRARADALAAVGEQARAAEAYQAALAADPQDAGLLAALASALSAAHGDAAAADADRRLIARAEAATGEVPPYAEAPSRFRLGIAAWAEGRPAEGIVHLDRALFLAPSDPRAGTAWTALADGHAARGEGAAALAAARGRADRAVALGLPAERRVALEAGAALAARFGDAGPDAGEVLDALLAVRAQAGDPPGELADLARRAAAALETAGEPMRAKVALARAGLTPSGPLAVSGPPAPGEPLPTPRVDAQEQARAAAERALAAEEPGERAALFTEYAEQLHRAGSAPEEIRTALELAADADPDAPGPWRARARIEAELGDPAEAARAHLAVAIRAEGGEATGSALEAARLFSAAGRHAEAARAFRAAQHASPDTVPAGLAAAEEALAAGDPPAAAALLAAVPRAALPPAVRAGHLRRLAESLDLAGDTAQADAAWTDLFREDPADPDAFTRAADHVYAQGGADAWLEVAAAHEAALGGWGEPGRRRDLCFARGTVLTGAGRLEDARLAYLAALEIDPEHAPAREALAALDARTDDWSALAVSLARGASTAEPAAAAGLYLRVARLLRDRLADPAGAILSLRSAVEKAREIRSAAALHVQEAAEALLVELGAPIQAAAAAAEPPSPAELADLEFAAIPTSDPVAEILRAQADEATGIARAELLERLAGHLERSGDRAAAADALFLALQADPERDLTYAWLVGLVEGDPERTERAAALRAPPAEPHEPGAFGLAEATAGFAERTTGDFPPPAGKRSERSTGELFPPTAEERAAFTGDEGEPPAAQEGERADRTTGDLYPPPGGEADQPEERLDRTTGDLYPPTAGEAAQPGERPDRTTGDLYPPSAGEADQPGERLDRTTGDLYPPPAGEAAQPEERLDRTTGDLYPPSAGEAAQPEERLDRTTGDLYPPSAEERERTTGDFPPPAEERERTTGDFPPPAEEAAPSPPELPEGADAFPPLSAEDLAASFVLAEEPAPPPPAEPAGGTATTGPWPVLTLPPPRPPGQRTTGPYSPPGATPLPRHPPERTTGDFPPPPGATPRPGEPTERTTGNFPPPPGPPARPGEPTEHTTGAFPPPGKPERLGRITGSFPAPERTERSTGAFPPPPAATSRPGEAPARTTGAFPPPVPPAEPTRGGTGTDTSWPTPSEPPARTTGTWPPPARPGEPAESELTVPPSAARPPPTARPPPRLQRRPAEDGSPPPLPPTPPPIPAAGRPDTDVQWPAVDPPLAGEPPPLPERHGTGQWPPPLRDARHASRPPAQLAAAGRSDLAAGRLDDARALLQQAFEREPSDLTLARDLQRIAEKQGRHEDYIQLGEVMADALAAYDPLAAAARYRHFAEIARARLGRDDRAAALLEKGLALVPDDQGARRELLELWASRPDTAPRALAAWLDTARADPGDGAALAAVASLCAGLSATAPRVESQRLTERGRIVASLAGFFVPGRVTAPPPPQPARALPPGLRERVALPGAAGPLGKLVSLLTPWLETLFPADLARRGATQADRLIPPRGASLRNALDTAMISLGARSYAPFLLKRPGIEIVIENTQPPSLVASADAETLPDGARAFLAARSIDLLTHGWALIGKFAPRDVGILLELACRFAGGAPPSLGLPDQRAGAFLKALETSVPVATRTSAQALGQAAAAELASLDPRKFSVALRRTAHRVALVHAGDAGGALAVLAQLERRPQAQGPEPRPLEHADVRDLAVFALSDAFLELRLGVRS